MTLWIFRWRHSTAQLIRVYTWATMSVEKWPVSTATIQKPRILGTNSRGHLTSFRRHHHVTQKYYQPFAFQLRQASSGPHCMKSVPLTSTFSTDILNPILSLVILLSFQKPVIQFFTVLIHTRSFLILVASSIVVVLLATWTWYMTSLFAQCPPLLQRCLQFDQDCSTFRCDGFLFFLTSSFTVPCASNSRASLLTPVHTPPFITSFLSPLLPDHDWRYPF